MFFRNPKKQDAPKLADVPACAESEGSWEPATVFYVNRPSGIVHMVVRPEASEGSFELEATSDIVPDELSEPNSRVEVLLVAGRILGVRRAGPGAASWFAQSPKL